MFLLLDLSFINRHFILSILIDRFLLADVSSLNDDS